MRNNPCPHEAGLTKLTHPANSCFLCPNLTRCPPHAAGPYTCGVRLFLFSCSAMVVVYGTPVRPSGRCQRPLQRAIRAAMTSLCTSQQALARGEFPTRDDERRLPGIGAARFLVTSPAHRFCSRRARFVPGTRSVCSANRTRGMQHVMPRTRAHVGTHVFRIQLLSAILTVHAAGLCPTWNVSGPDREDARVQAEREVRHGPRTRRRVNPAR